MRRDGTSMKRRTGKEEPHPGLDQGTRGPTASGAGSTCLFGKQAPVSCRSKLKQEWAVSYKPGRGTPRSQRQGCHQATGGVRAGPGGDTLSLCHLYPNPPSLVHGVHRKWLPPAPASTYYNPATGRQGPLLLVLVPYSQDGASGWVSWDQVPAPPWPEGRVAEHRHGQSSQADIPACISNESP